MEPVEAMESLRMKFTSGNDVPVGRAMITREEYEAVAALQSELEKAKTENERWRQIVTDDLKDIDKAKAAFTGLLTVAEVYGDTFGVPTIDTVCESAAKKLQAQLAQDKTLREAVEKMLLAFEKSKVLTMGPSMETQDAVVLDILDAIRNGQAAPAAAPAPDEKRNGTTTIVTTETIANIKICW